MLEHVLPIALLLRLVLPVCTVLWPGWILGKGAMSIALARLARRRRGRLAHLTYERYGAIITLTTSDPGVRQLEELGTAMLLPGWGGVAAAYLLTVAGGLAITGPTFYEWPLWTSAIFAVSWAAGWVWYVVAVRSRYLNG